MTLDGPHSIRQAIIDTLPHDSSGHGAVSEGRYVYAPPSHLKALRLDCSLVIGTRGVGKTFWSAALTSEKVRTLLGPSLSDLSRLDVATGYSERPAIDHYPNADTFGALLAQGLDAYDIWRAVLARWLARILPRTVPEDEWKTTVLWLKENPEPFSRMLEQANEHFDDKNCHGLIVFDALDRTSDDWRTMDDIVRQLLRVILSLKPFSRLHGKVFLREDQFSGRQVTDFPDASKLLATRVDLTWAPHDLHGLLWQYLCNGPGAAGAQLRRFFERMGGRATESAEGIWTLPDRAKRDNTFQRSLFQELAGAWMGRDPRRGIPYMWSVGHLADGRGRTSPRSFLAAIRTAAEDSRERYPDHPTPLHYESIKRGVQEASKIRVNELAEDYPWVKTLMAPLSGLTVPSPLGDIEQRWRDGFGWSPEAKVFEGRLPPEHLEDGWKGVARDLTDLGIFETMKDSRINMPDLYRVGFGLGRRGGVKPVDKRAPT
jgi:hypothetical protein